MNVYCMSHFHLINKGFDVMNSMTVDLSAIDYETVKIVACDIMLYAVCVVQMCFDIAS